MKYKLSDIIKMATTPEVGVGWYWVALWSGHVFVGFWLALWVHTVSDTDPIVIDIASVFGYFIFKEWLFDIRLNGSIRDSMTDTMAVGFGSYTVTCLLANNVEAAFWTINFAAIVGIYGLLFSLERESEE